MTPLIYLDNAATTAPLPEISSIYRQYADDFWLNPSALYAPAVEVRRAVEASRDAVLAAFGSCSHTCTFTSGGTEAANMVVRFGARRRKGANYVCAGFEHPCVEESFKQLQEDGLEVRTVQTDSDGSTSLGRLMDAVDEHTVLVSVMHVSNETGAVNDIDEMVRAVKMRAPGAAFHSDGVQAFGRVVLRRPDAIDYYTVSAHKIHGVKGTGAVFSRRGSSLRQMLRGGGQEHGLRSGTENVLGILAFGRAAEYFRKNHDAISAHLIDLRDAFISRVQRDSSIDVVALNGAPHIVSLFVADVRGETLMHAMERAGVIVATGSACSSKKGKSRASHALGVTDSVAASMVRISFCPTTTHTDVLRAADALIQCASDLRSATRMQQ